MIDFVKENPGATVAIFIFLFSLTHALGGALLYLLWRMFTRVEGKVDKWLENCGNCKEGLLSKGDFKDWCDSWTPGRVEIWKRANYHHHDKETGKVIIE